VAGRVWAALSRWPDADVFGGPILPHFDEPPPMWLQRGLPQVANAYALLDLGPEPVLFDERRLPFGANYAIRTRCSAAGAVLPRARARRHGAALGEETMVVRALLAAGARGRWVPEARVAHLVPRARQNLRFLRAYYRGTAPPRTPTRASTGGARPAPARASALGVAPGRRAAAALLAAPPTAPPERWLLHLRLASSAWGTLLARVPGEEGRAGG
jgi:hypothetical protein